MKRRAFIAGLGALAVAPAAAQQSGKPRRIGYLYFSSRQSAIDSGRYPSLLQGLRELGYVEGRDFVIEGRFADGKSSRISDLAADLVKAKVDVIVTGGTPANVAAIKATTSIPIVIATSPDPVAGGLIASLGRPGGNVTGVSSGSAEVDPKHVELLHSAVPKLSRLAVMANPANVSHAARIRNVEASAQKLGIPVIAVKAESAEAIDRGFGAIAERGATALILLNDSYFVQQERQIADLALKLRLPSICALRGHAEAGGLMSYGPNINENFRRAASYVDRIFKGAKAGDLPIEQPRVFELVINLKTAKALGLQLPKPILFMAAKVIE